MTDEKTLKAMKQLLRPMTGNFNGNITGRLTRSSNGIRIDHVVQRPEKRRPMINPSKSIEETLPNGSRRKRTCRQQRAPQILSTTNILVNMAQASGQEVFTIADSDEEENSIGADFVATVEHQDGKSHKQEQDNLATILNPQHPQGFIREETVNFEDSQDNSTDQTEPDASRKADLAPDVFVLGNGEAHASDSNYCEGDGLDQLQYDPPCTQYTGPIETAEQVLLQIKALSTTDRKRLLKGSKEIEDTCTQNWETGNNFSSSTPQQIPKRDANSKMTAKRLVFPTSPDYLSDFYLICSKYELAESDDENDTTCLLPKFRFNGAADGVVQPEVHDPPTKKQKILTVEEMMALLNNP